MHHINALDALLPKTRQGILATLLLHPEKEWYVSELARWMNVTQSSLQRELADLTAAGILKTHRQGRMAFYQANTDLPIFPDLKNLLLKTTGLVNVLTDALNPLKPKILLAFIFGSIASGQEESASDVDLLIVGTLKSVELALPLRQAANMLRRDINPVLYSANEFSRKSLNADHFLSSVLKKPKLFVIGGADELASAAR